jgi:hypothetical protein
LPKNIARGQYFASVRVTAKTLTKGKKGAGKIADKATGKGPAGKLKDTVGGKKGPADKLTGKLGKKRIREPRAS